MLQTRNNLAIAISPPVGGTSLRLRASINEPVVKGTAITGALYAVGGTPPFAFSEVTTNLAGVGLALNANGTITGTPTTVGVVSFVAQVQDAALGIFVATFSINVRARVAAVPGANAPVDGELQTPYNYLLKVSGAANPLYWTVSSGSLPPGLSLGGQGPPPVTTTTSGAVVAYPATGTQTGWTVPVVSASGIHGRGEYVYIHDATFAHELRGAIMLQVGPPGPGQLILDINTIITGGTAPGTMPTGATVTTEIGGLIQGTPTAVGIYTFIVTATDSVTGDNVPFEITMRIWTHGTVDWDNATENMGFEWEIAPAILGENYTATVHVTGGKPPYSGFYDYTGQLASLGLSVDPGTGTISGTVTDPTLALGPYTKYNIAVGCKDALGIVQDTASGQIQVINPQHQLQQQVGGVNVGQPGSSIQNYSADFLIDSDGTVTTIDLADAARIANYFASPVTVNVTAGATTPIALPVGIPAAILIDSTGTITGTLQFSLQTSATTGPGQTVVVRFLDTANALSWSADFVADSLGLPASAQAGTTLMFETDSSNKLHLIAQATTGGGGGSGTNTGDVTLAAVGSTPNANAASLVGQVLTLQPADATHPGVMTAIAQTFGGDKTFNGVVATGATFNLPASVSSTVGAILFGGAPIMHCAGVFNVFLGSGAGFNAYGVTGQNNISIGRSTGANLTSGGSNILLGRNTGLNLLDGSLNTVIGTTSLSQAVSTTQNTGFGASTLVGVTGNQNTAVGANAGGTNLTGNQNLTLGYFATVANSTDSGLMSIQNIIYGFANLGTSATVSTGRIAIGKNTDDGVNQLQVAGSFVASNFSGSHSGTASGTNTGDVTLAAVGSAPNANAATLAGQVLTLQIASASFPGVVSTGAQSFAGAKTFTGTIAAANLSGTNTGDVTLGAVGSAPNANAASLAGQVLTLQIASASFPGVVSTAAQTFAGDKTFSGNIAAANFSGSHSGASSGTNTGDLTLAAVGSVSNANAASLVGQVLTLQSASASFPGVVSTAAQSFAGAKTFAALATFSAGASLPAGTADFGSTTRQMIGLWGASAGSGYGIGVQSGTMYCRSGGGYAWYAGGVHSDAQNDPGAGGSILGRLDSSGNLTIPGNLSAANFPGAASGVTTLAAVGAAPNANAGTIAGNTLNLQPAAVSFPGVVTATGTQTFGGNKTFSGATTMQGLLVQGTLTAKYNYPGYFDNGNFGASGTINWNNGNFQALGINGSCSVAFSAPPAMCMLYLDIFCGSAGTLTWPAGVKGSPPTVLSGGKNSVFSFLFDGTSTYYYMGGAINV